MQNVFSAELVLMDAKMGLSDIRFRRDFLSLFSYVFYGISDRTFANIIIPVVYHDRSSMYEHGGNPPNGLGDRHHTSSHGLADIRLSAGYWSVMN